MPNDVGQRLRSPAGIRDPYSVYERLRGTAPVYWSDTYHAWLVTTHEYVREVYRSHDVFSSEGKTARNLHELPEDVRSELTQLALVEESPVLSSADPPTHTRHRKLINRPLTKRSLASEAEWIDAVCEELIDQIGDQSSFDVIASFSKPLAYRVILGLFGASEENIPIYEESTRAREAFVDPAGSSIASARRYENALRALRKSIESEFLRGEGSDDSGIIASLIASHESGSVTRDEMFAMLKTFFAAGQENIIYAIPTTLYYLLQNPEQRDAVIGEPEHAALAFEEGVRFDTPVQFNPRVAKQDVNLGAQPIRAGDAILNFKGSANRDPEAWSRPDTFDIWRDFSEPPGGSVMFGQGIHFCAGSGIARLVGPSAIRALLARFPRMRLATGWTPDWPTPRKLASMRVST